MRLFIGLELPTWIKDQLLTVQVPLPSASWQTAERLHLTLSFVGAVNDQQVPAIQWALASLHMEPFRLRLDGSHVFGTPLRPTLFWAGVAPEAPVKALHNTVEAQPQTLGLLRLPSSRFQPHITLARMGRLSGDALALLRTDQDLYSESFRVNRIALV